MELWNDSERDRERVVRSGRKPKDIAGKSRKGDENKGEKLKNKDSTGRAREGETNKEKLLQGG